jgi:predicted nucleotidyltransferase
LVKKAHDAGLSTIPVRVCRPLRAIVSILRETFGDGLVGIYLYGSLTQGAFSARRSDIDVLAVLQRSPTRRQFRELGRRLERAGAEDKWIGRIQMQVLLRDRLLRSDKRGAYFQFGVLKRSGSDGNPLIWVNVLDSGITLAGVRAESILPPITETMVRAALIREIEYLRAEVADSASPWRDKRFYRAYAVLTVCRILYTLSVGGVVSKPKAAAWALRKLPSRWHGLIRAAQSSDRGRMARLSLPRIGRFVAYGAEMVSNVAVNGDT